jgi:branched-chain amino acid transport system permease protein
MEYLLHILIMTTIFATAGLGITLMSGFAGMISIAQGAFVGLGAYAVAILSVSLGMNFFLAMILGIILCAIVGFILGYIFSKLDGDYFVLGTLGFAMLIYSLAQNLASLTRGPLGIPGIPSPTIFGAKIDTNSEFLILALVIFALTYFLAEFLGRSSFGRALKSIREDERVLEIFGYRTTNYKLVVFVIASCFGALSGALFGSYLTFIEPGSFNLPLSTFILTVIILGGLDSLKGAVLGAFLLVLIPEALRFAGFPVEVAAQLREFLYGAVLVAFMLYRPKGLLGKYKL